MGIRPPPSHLSLDQRGRQKEAQKRLQLPSLFTQDPMEASLAQAVPHSFSQWEAADTSRKRTVAPCGHASHNGSTCPSSADLQTAFVWPTPKHPKHQKHRNGFCSSTWTRAVLKPTPSGPPSASDLAAVTKKDMCSSRYILS